MNDLFAVGVKSRCDQLCEALSRLVPVNNLSELRWHAGTLTISKQAFAENTAARFGVSSGRNNSLSTGLKLEECDENEPVGDWPFRDLVGC